ncbi:MAG: TM2 domain-containing membrane protein YozV, partial [Bradymonadia bacterium]
YLVQAFIEGPTLAKELKSRRYTEDEVLEILTSICDVLTYLHALQPPVIHRDLKPGNLVRRTDGALVLIDFGAVRDVLRDPTLGGSTVAGTYGYMAPEQFSGDASPATDLYALGVLAIALLSRRDPLDLMKGHRLDWQPVVHASAATKALIEQLLAPLSIDRPASARVVQTRIEGILRGDVDARDGTELVATGASLPAVLRPAKQRSTAVALALLGCLFGLHNWYLRRWGRALASAVFSWTLVPAFLSLGDAFKMLTQGEVAFDTRYNPEHVAVERARAEDVMRQIEQLHALREKGALTEAEFGDQKARLLGRGDGIFDRLSGQLGGQLTDLVDQLHGLPDQLMGRHHGRIDDWLNRSIQRQETRHRRRKLRRDERRDRRDRR